MAGYTLGGGGRGYILKLNPFGDTIWTRTLPNVEFYTAAPSFDNGVILGGADFTVKYSSSGQLIWNNYYGNSNVLCYHMERTSDDKYISCGVDLNTNWDGFALKTDNMGNLIWHKIYPSNFLTRYESIVESYDGNYIMIGSNLNFELDTTKIIVTKIDTSGNVIWNKFYKIRNRQSQAESMCRINNFYVISGEVSGLGVYFMKLASNGDSVYTKIFNSTVFEYQYDFKIINSNRYVFAIEKDTNIPPYGNAKLLITDSLGNILNSRILPGNDFVLNEVVQPLQNGDIVWGGRIDYATGTDKDVFVMRTDSMLYAPPAIGLNIISGTIPERFELYQNYPNPFNPITNFRVDLPKKGNASVIIYNAVGQEAAKLYEGILNAGEYEFQWQASNTLASGIYFYSLFFDGALIDTKKMVLLK